MAHENDMDEKKKKKNSFYMRRCCFNIQFHINYCFFCLFH